MKESPIRLSLIPMQKSILPEPILAKTNEQGRNSGEKNSGDKEKPTISDYFFNCTTAGRVIRFIELGKSLKYIRRQKKTKRYGMEVIENLKEARVIVIDNRGKLQQINREKLDDYIRNTKASRILECIKNKPEISQGKLASELKISKFSVEQEINNLREYGLLEKRDFRKKS